MNKVIIFTKNGKEVLKGTHEKFSAARWHAYNLSKKRNVNSAHAVNSTKECVFTNGKSMTFKLK